MKAQKSTQYTNNASGNLNKQQQKNKYKIIDLDQFDVQMVSPQFLQNKTLKKPFKEYEISSIKTNPNGIKQASYQYRHQPPTKEYPQVVIFKKDQLKNNKKEKTVSIIDTSQLNIKPAFKRDQPQIMINNFNKVAEGTTEKDKNTILAAMIKKGMKPQIVIKPQTLIPKQQKKAGPAQSKLKAMMGKSSSTKVQLVTEKPKKQELKRQKQGSQIGEQINQDIDQYGNQSFQKLSGAYESVIRQSIIGDSNIRQSIAGDSNIIKQSIRESIRESVASSSGKIKQSIREDIKESIQQSSRSLKEEIIEEISASHRKSKESIEEVYEDIFQQQSSNSLSKSQSRFKKSVRVNQSDSLSQSASKSFRMKNIAKSLKYAQQLVKKQKTFIKIDPVQNKKIVESINQEKSNLKKIQQNISKLLGQKPASLSSDKNKDLYYNFKIQVNKLLTGDLFQSKLKKLVSFLTIGNDILPNKQYVDELEDNILKNIMFQIENIKVGKSHLNQVQKVRKEYEDKLTQQLRMQQVNLRAEMNQKLSEKDLQLKKMIAQLESRMMSRTIQTGGVIRENYSNVSKGQLYEVQSDYSIDSDNISWKADLWQLLPQYEKKKLYQKQTAEVTKFLADVMINQIKQQALERSLDISFEFPEEFNFSNSYEQPATPKSWKQNINDSKFVKKESEVKHQRQFLSDLPKIPVKKISPDDSKVFNAPREDSQTKFEPIRKDQKIKPEVIKILSDYKNIYIKKKQETIKLLLKVLTSKDIKVQNFMYSSLQQITILTEKEYKKDHQMYIKAYEQELVMSLITIYTRSMNKKQTSIQEQMKKMYDRLVVVAQIATAEKCMERVSLDVEKNAEFNVEALTKDALKRMEQVPCTIQILANDNYMDLKAKKEEKQVKNQIVQHIISILSSEFAREFPKRKK